MLISSVAMFFIFRFATFDQIEKLLGHIENSLSIFQNRNFQRIDFSVEISFENGSFYFTNRYRARPLRKAGEKSKILDEKKQLVNFRVLLLPLRLVSQFFHKLGIK